MIKIKEFISSRIGKLTDLIAVPFSIGAVTNTILAHLNTAYYHMHGQFLVYPTAASNVVLTAAAGAWSASGVIKEVIPANALATADFDLHWINVSDISENAECEIQIFAGASGSVSQIGATRPVRNTVQSQEGARRIHIPQQHENVRISCRLLSSTTNATTLDVSFEGHYYA